MTAVLQIEETTAIRIPIRLERHGGRKLVIAPDHGPKQTRRPDEKLIRALAKAHRWRRRIESGAVKSITDLAADEGVTNAYVCRLLKLTCLAPDLVADILDGRLPSGFLLQEIKRDLPHRWDDQRRLLAVS